MDPEDRDIRQRRIDARLRARISKALGGNTKELVRLLNWEPHLFGHTAELIEWHRAHGALSDQAAQEFAIWVAVGEMRNLAEDIIRVEGIKNPTLRKSFCMAIRVLMDSGLLAIGGYDYPLWTQPQVERMNAIKQELAPRLIVALWDASDETLRRLRRCRFPKCKRPWFVDDAKRRPRSHCKASHRVRTAEACAPLKEQILEVLKTTRGGWITRSDLEGRVKPDDTYFFATALEALAHDKAIDMKMIRLDSPRRHADKPARSTSRPRVHPVEEFVSLEVTQYRLA